MGNERTICEDDMLLFVHDSQWCWVSALLTAIGVVWIVTRFLIRSYLFPNARADFQSMQPLKLWGYEGSPFVRPVRETLSSLGLAHVFVNCARGSSNRDKLFELTGRFQVPFLQDPNTGVEMFESGEIVKYLMAMYTEKP